MDESSILLQTTTSCGTRFTDLLPVVLFHKVRYINGMKRLSVVIPEDLHKSLKMLAAERGLSISDFVKAALFDTLKKENYSRG